jgi:hypothetical protein
LAETSSKPRHFLGTVVSFNWYLCKRILGRLFALSWQETLMNPRKLIFVTLVAWFAAPVTAIRLAGQEQQEHGLMFA